MCVSCARALVCVDVAIVTETNLHASVDDVRRHSFAEVGIVEPVDSIDVWVPLGRANKAPGRLALVTARVFLKTE